MKFCGSSLSPLSTPSHYSKRDVAARFAMRNWFGFLNFRGNWKSIIRYFHRRCSLSRLTVQREFSRRSFTRSSLFAEVKKLANFFIHLVRADFRRALPTSASASRELLYDHLIVNEQTGTAWKRNNSRELNFSSYDNLALCACDMYVDMQRSIERS